MSEVSINVLDNGPLIVKGGVTITDSEGKTYEVKETIYLCRCGLSDNKPFCDARHKDAGFASTPRATA